MKKLTFLLFIILHLCAFSQTNKSLVVRGLVTDINNQPISGANVSLLTTAKGTRTDTEGHFYLKVREQYGTLKISHVAYFSKNTELIGTIINDTLKIKITLIEKVNELAPFSIGGEKIEVLYNKPFVTIYDYEFYENKLLLLIREAGKTKIKLTDLDQNDITELIVPTSTKKIYSDCFNNIHLINKDSVCQIEIYENNIRIAYSITVNKFNQLLKPCITAFKKYFLFKKNSFTNQSLVYYSINENREVKHLKKIENKIAENKFGLYKLINKKLAGVPDYVLLKELALYGPIPRDPFDPRKIDVEAVKNMRRRLSFELKHLSSSPLFAIKNKVYIFDHDMDSCYIFNESLVFEKSFVISYHLEKNWTQELILDQKQGEIYAEFKKGGLSYLKKINLTTGEIMNTYKIEEHLYLTNIKIRDYTAYYIYKDRFNHGQTILFKQDLY